MTRVSRLTCLTVLALAVLPAAPAVAQGTVSRTYAASPSFLGEIPRCSGTRPVFFPGVDDMVVQSVTLSVTLNVTDASFLRLALRSSANDSLSIGLPRPAPLPTPLSGTYTFTDTAPQDFYQVVQSGAGSAPAGAYRVSNDAGAPQSLDGRFGGQRSVVGFGVWTADLSEDCGAVGAAASIVAASLTVVGHPVPAVTVASPSALRIPEGPGGPQQPGAPLDVAFVVPPGRGSVQSVAIRIVTTHEWAGEAVAQLIAPDGTAHVLFGYTGAPDLSSGSSAVINGINNAGYAFSDVAVRSWWQSAADAGPGGNLPAGSYRTSQPGGPGATGAPTLMDPVFAGKPSEGTWTLRLTDGGNRGAGYVWGGTLSLVTSVPPAPPVAAPEAFSTPFQTPLVLQSPGVLVNDTSTASGSWTVAVETAPSFGTVVLDPSGGFVYAPNPGFSGQDSFTYRSMNLVGPSAPATVSITVAPPVALPSGTLVTRTFNVGPAGLGPIPRGRLEQGGEGTGLICTGGGFSFPFTVPDDLLVQSMTVTVTANITRAGLLGLVLRSPGRRDFVATGVNLGAAGNAPLLGTFTFSDTSGADLWTTAAANPTGVPPGTYRGAAQRIAIDAPSAGAWTLSAAEYCHTGLQGRIDAMSVAIHGLLTAPVRAEVASLGDIPDGPGGPQQPGSPLDVRFVVPPGRGDVRSVSLAFTIAHQRRGDVVARLIAPDGTAHVILGYVGAADSGPGSLTVFNGDVVFSDRASTTFSPFVFDGTFRTVQLGGPGSAGAPTAMDTVFAGHASEGVWTLRFTDGNSGFVGGVLAASLSLLTSAVPAPPLTSPDAYTTVVNTGISIPPPGILGNDMDPSGGGISAALVSSPSSGTLVFDPDGSFIYTPNAGFIGNDQFTYRAANAAWTGLTATVTIAVGPPTTIQPPTGFRVSSIVGNRVTLQWNPPALGPSADGYVIEAGVAPGQTLAAIRTLATPLQTTVTAPDGVFLARVHGLLAGAKSAASNEVRIVVNAPVPPSAPTALTGLVHGSTVSLAWQPTFDGGAPTAMVLDVSGSAVGSLPLPVSDAFTVAGVPAGAYTLAVRAVNTAGPSPSSNAVTVVVPDVCSGLPDTPVRFVAYAAGSDVHLSWETPATGAAATSYLVAVSGTFNGAVPVAARIIAGPVAAGTYTVSVRAVNACGASAPTAVQTLVVPAP